MRLGHIAYSYKPFGGGAEHYIKIFLDMLDENCFKQTVYQAKTESTDLEIQSIPVFNLPFLRKKPSYTYNLLLNIKLSSLLKEDVLIVHDPFHFWPVFWHPKVITVSHGVRWDRPSKTERLYNRIHLASAKFAFNNSYKIVANDSNFFRALGISLKPKEKMFAEVLPNKWFIPNCVDTSLFKKIEPLSVLRKLNPILVPRNVVPGRGIHLAIQAFSGFVKNFPETNLVICGDFSDRNYNKKLFSTIQELDLIRKVYFIGSIKWEFMPKIYSSSLLTVIPTNYEEGTSLAALESMSCETATVSTNIGGLADLPSIQSANCTPEELSYAMKKTFAARNKIGNQQSKKIRKIYNLKNFKNAWLRVIRT